MSEAFMEELFNEDLRRLKISNAMKGSNHPNWRGGKSYEPYCIKFDNEFKEKIRDKFNHTCFLCGISEEDNGVKLGVHHVTYDKECLCGDVKCDFVPLCISCHAKTNSNRKMWEKRIKVLLELV